MITFSYNDDYKMIVAQLSKDDYGRGIYLKGGVWRAKSNSYWFPLNDENIVELYKKYAEHEYDKDYATPAIVWKISLKEAILKYFNDRANLITSQNFLNTLTVDNISKYPVLRKDKHADLKPFKNQHISQYYGNYVKHHALLWEMGTGKTRAAIDMYEIKKELGQVTHGIVICPLSMVNKWVAEIDFWSNGSACPLKGTKEEKLETIEEGWEWIVLTYETLERYQDVLLPHIDDNWFAVLDETTKIKNPHAKRTKACWQLGLKTVHKVILTGTPVTQNAYDVFSQFRFLDNGETFGFNYDDFISNYFWKSGFKLIAKRGTPEKISELMFGKSTRFLKKDCIDIPDKLYDQRILEMPVYNREKYNEMVKYAITQLENAEVCTAPIIITQLLRLSQITSGFVKDVVGAEKGFKENPKLNALEEIIEQTNGNKMVVWARFQWDVEQIVALCKRLEVGVVELYGKTQQDQRTRNIERFQNDPNCKVIVGTAGTGGHGIDLVAAGLVVYYSNSYSLEQRLQSEDRSHRAGQKNQVQYIDLLCKDTIDVSIYKILRTKKNIADIVTRDNIRSFLS